MNNIGKSLTLIVILAASLCSLPAEAKTALLVTHYGSSDDTTRTLTIDKITADIRSALPLLEVREAYISPIVRRNLAKRGVSVESPVDALLRLRVEGYDTVFVQPTTMIDGIETAEVRKFADRVSPFFGLITVGQPLLDSPADCCALVSILEELPSRTGETVIYVGHGNDRPSTATYTQLDYMLHVGGRSDCHVSTIEGYPTAQTTLIELKRDKKIRNVTLVPLLLVCGNHTKNDLAGEFADVIRSAGYRVDILMRGLAELPAVRDLYVKKALTLVGSH